MNPFVLQSVLVVRVYPWTSKIDYNQSIDIDIEFARIDFISIDINYFQLGVFNQKSIFWILHFRHKSRLKPMAQ